jgi:hypothetical protein
MTTPAILYDHIPVVEKDNGDDDQQYINDYSSSSILSYFVSRIVYRASAPPEHADETTYHQPPKLALVQKVDPEQEDTTEPEDDSNNVSLPMETIWEDNVCTEYVFVPYSALSEDINNDEYNGNMVCHPSVLKKLHHVMRTLFSSKHNIFASSSQGHLAVPSRSDRQGTKGQGSMLQSVILDTFVYLSSYLFSTIASHSSSSSSIFKSYDWVSETVLDDTGNHLILPGALVVMDASQTDLSEMESSIFQAAQSRNFSNTGNDPCEGALNVPLASDGEVTWSPAYSLWSKWPMRKTAVMVSAYDLLSVERQKKSQKCHRVAHHHMDASTSSTSHWPFCEDNGDLAEITCFLQSRRQRLSLGHQSFIIPKNVETATVLRAMWKLANNRTRRWCWLSFYRIKRTAKSLGQALICSSSTDLRYPADLAGTSSSDLHPDSSSHFTRKLELHSAEQIPGVEFIRRVDIMEYLPLDNTCMIEMTLVTSDASLDGAGNDR